LTSATFPAAGGAATDPWRSHPARIRHVAAEVPGVRTYELELEDPAVRAAYRFAPGQFNMLHLPGIGEAAISIASDPAQPMLLAHTVRAVGNVTDALARLGAGASLMVRGPFGRPWPLDACRGRDVVLVSGGLGLASQRAAIHWLVRHRAAVRGARVLHGAKRPDGLLYAAEYDAWRRAGLDVRVTVDAPGPGWAGPVGLVTDLLADLPLDADRAVVLCCGPDAMMFAVAARALALGIAAERIHVSLERNMACAVRHCGLCQFGPLFVCQDGPVFPYASVARFLAVPQL